MVTTPRDPIRVPTITLSQAELEEIEAEIAAERLPADFLERHYEAVQNNVFGHDHRTDANGRPIEQGRGSAANQTHQSVEAYRKWGKDEPDYERNLARMEKQLAACDAERKARAASAGRKVGR
jgi:hypothetical protein